jgi:hypothetical protein
VVQLADADGTLSYTCCYMTICATPKQQRAYSGPEIVESDYRGHIQALAGARPEATRAVVAALWRAELLKHLQHAGGGALRNATRTCLLHGNVLMLTRKAFHRISILVKQHVVPPEIVLAKSILCNYIAFLQGGLTIHSMLVLAAP